MAFLEDQATVRPVQNPGGVLVPGAAVAEDGEGVYVMVVAGDVVERRPVVTGETQGGRVRIVSGLDTGERVVADLTVALLAGLADGARVSLEQ